MSDHNEPSDGGIRKSKRKILMITILVAVAALWVGYLNIGMLVKKGIVTGAPLVVKVPVSLADVSVSPFSGEGEITGFVIGNPEGYTTPHAFSLDRVKIAVDLKSLATDKIHIREVLIQRPSVIYEGTFSESNILKIKENIGSTATSNQTEGEGGGGGEEKKSKSLQIDTFVLEEAQVTVKMKILGDKPHTFVVPTIKLTGLGAEENRAISEITEDIMQAFYREMLPRIAEVFVLDG